jgi:hypothetical protein
LHHLSIFCAFAVCSIQQAWPKTCEFRILQTVKLLYPISAEINNKSKLIARLLSLLGISLGHPVALRDQVRQRSKEWEYD